MGDRLRGGRRQSGPPLRARRRCGGWGGGGADPTRFIIDEKNGILIDAALADRTIASHFEVGKVAITATYRLVPGDAMPKWNTALPAGGRNAPTPPPDRIIVEMHTFSLDEPRASGGEGGIPPVKSRRLVAVQRAELERQP